MDATGRSSACPFVHPVIGLIALFVCACTDATTIRVPADRPTIQSAIAAAADSDTVLVAAGTYFEHIDYLGKALAVQSESGSAVTTIDGAAVGTVVTIAGISPPAMLNGASLRGFTIRNGSNFFGSGISLYFASPRIYENVIADNHQLVGGSGTAIDGFNASPAIDHNIFSGNTCDSQYASGVITFVNGSSPGIHDNLFRDNDCRAINMVLPQGAAPNVFNNTIVRNRVGIHVDQNVPTATQVYRNNIIALNGIGVEVVGGSPPLNATWRNNLVNGNATDFSGTPDPAGSGGNLNLDPMFANVAASDFRVRTGSPAIDAADSSGLGLSGTDLAGSPRIQDGDGNGIPVLDIGAFEAPAPSLAVPTHGGGFLVAIGLFLLLSGAKVLRGAQ